jgi:arylamine N-acetyltransferase
VDTTALLRRIGLARSDELSVAALTELHSAFVDHVPYETIQFQFGQGGSLDPEDVASRVIAREAGGYCFQLNGLFAALLTDLGYRVEMHRGGVQTPSRAAAVDATHMTLTVSGLRDAPDEWWLVDVGLGDGLLAPIRLQPGTTSQEPYDLTLRRSEIADGWRLDLDPRSTITGVDFESEPVALDAFVAQHTHLSRSPDSPFVRTSSAYRRTATSSMILRSLRLTQTFADHIESRVLETPADYFTVLDELFRLPLGHLTRPDRDLLWGKAITQYEDWLVMRSGQAPRS